MSVYVFDFDGTLIDASDRLYKLFQYLVPESSFSKDEYWALKRNKISHKMIIEKYFSGRSFDDFNEKWLSLIESVEYLDYDILYNDTVYTLKKLSQSNKLFLLTARQNKEHLLAELDRFNLACYFSKIFVTENKVDKAELIKEIDLATTDFFVSDMGKDIIIGNKLGIKTIAITHGFMNKYNLLQYKPWKVVDHLREISF